MDVPAAPLRVEVRTRDREVATEAINRVIAHRARIRFENPGAVDLAFRSADYDGLGAFRSRLDGVRYTADVPPLPSVAVGMIADGAARIRLEGFEAVLRGQDGLLVPDDTPVDGEFSNIRMMFVTLPLAYLEGVAGLPGLRFEAFTPVSGQMRRFWADTTIYLVRQITAPDMDLNPLLVEQLRRTAATSALSVFPNTMMTSSYRPGPGREPMVAVRRAIAYMEQHAAQPLTVAEVAAAAGIGPRGLQAAFRRHLDTTPLEHLRRIRLERVRQELATAGPGSGVTVGEIARRWGFANPGRFAGHYRAAFGVLPGQTLRE